ncbi:Heptaprenyl diphosphate synthase component I [Thermotoga petrophila RKU-10]|uniref:Heptaprenyl diphosphate synthase component I n=3 Tax=Thermotoga petrophila TaxID=93929 RepID=A5IM28_THEP1|nr:Gx transporter family protein [Thermotoga petrophila]ABQ47251.1 Heptaprenyl diphosphate synthase component I [Thermotoga petrophila RKU-1]ADA67338.1 Heptaprenyl diphosphate synthase component I [Thermotoga petrophila RKU-10]
MRRITFLSVLTALSSTFYVLENLLPFPVPFGRWGFSNSVVLMIASEIGFGDALIVASAKSILGALFSGRFLSPSFLTGFFGAVSASLVESFLARFDFGYLSLSAMGSFVNNLVQLIVISFLVGSTKTFLLFPLMVILGLVSGTVNAFLASKMGGIVFENYSRFFFAQKKATDGITGDRVRS